MGGTVTIQNSAHVGSAGARLAEVHVAGGCRLNSSALHSPCGPADAVYSTATPDATPTGLEKPPVDLPYWYANSKPGPRQACTTQTGTPPAFDNDTTMNRSLPSAVNLTPALAYDCQVRDGQGNLLGQIAWTPGSPGTLTIAGTLFFDGSITFQNSVNPVYVGRATIYAAGTITLQNSYFSAESQGATRTGRRPRTCLPSSRAVRPTPSASRSRTARSSRVRSTS